MIVLISSRATQAATSRVSTPPVMRHNASKVRQVFCPVAVSPPGGHIGGTLSCGKQLGSTWLTLSLAFHLEQVAESNSAELFLLVLTIEFVAQ